jgi:Uma2 family endonuclease
MTQTIGNIKPVHTSELVFPLSVEQYHEMIRLGVLTDDDPVELIEGVLVFHMPKNPPHRFVTRAVFDAISALLPNGWHCQMQEPITLNDGEPEPDVSVIRGRTTEYRDRHPAAADVGLVIEVADSTLERDRGIKLRSYARAGIAEYWIVNILDRQVEVFRGPNVSADPPEYVARTVYREDQSVPIEIDGRSLGELIVASILP